MRAITTTILAGLAALVLAAIPAKADVPDDVFNKAFPEAVEPEKTPWDLGVAYGVEAYGDRVYNGLGVEARFTPGDWVYVPFGFYVGYHADDDPSSNSTAGFRPFAGIGINFPVSDSARLGVEFTPLSLAVSQHMFGWSPAGSVELDIGLPWKDMTVMLKGEVGGVVGDDNMPYGGLWLGFRHHF